MTLSRATIAITAPEGLEPQGVCQGSTLVSSQRVAVTVHRVDKVTDNVIGFDLFSEARDGNVDGTRRPGSVAQNLRRSSSR